MSFAYWNPAILEQSRLLNVQDGRYVDVRINRGGDRGISSRIGNGPRPSLLASAEDLDITLWYSADNYEWLGSRIRDRERGTHCATQRIEPTAGQWAKACRWSRGCNREAVWGITIGLLFSHVNGMSKHEPRTAPQTVEISHVNYSD